MEITQLLKKEIEGPIKGTYAPFYFKYLGYKESFSISKALARANAIKNLFSKPLPYIYKNDRIVGSIRPLWSENSKEELDKAADIVNSYGERNFLTNFDHYSPNYSSFVQKGIPGLLADIANSEKNTRMSIG